ncbi:hypothetical protein [Streptomyces griseoaurantiacus]|uniref:hypothetical protein n=1 Tax=Streptomyces griseoaurantiacus TaxID=68213 RepID=UPI002E2DE483|nr:hypothetical protein [Streptomyces jietaisiensis]
MAFQFDGYLLSIKPARHVLTLIPGWGVHRLTLFFEAAGTGDIPEGQAHQLSGELWVNDMGNSGWLGPLMQRWPMEAHPEGRNISFDVALTDAQILGLEKARKGRELELRVDLTAVQLGAIAGWPARTDQLTVRISHEEWAKTLAQLDAGAFVDVLVPVTEVENRATAARRLREAKSLIGAGRFEEAVGKARLALDAVREACDTVNVVRNLPSAQQRSQEQRWGMLIQSAYQLFSGAQHDDSGTTEHFTWSRADAIAAVATAAGLLARLEDLQ